jgi:F-type H+-transporting ATPase subunit b
MELLKLLNPRELIVQLISFLILFFIVRKYLWINFMKFLDERREKMDSDLKSIENAQREIARSKTDYEARMSEIEKQAREKIQAAVVQGKKDAEQIKLEAQEEAQNIIVKAQESIRHEVTKAREELKSDIVSLALSAAEVVVKEKMTPEKDRRLVEEFISRVEKVE